MSKNVKVTVEMNGQIHTYEMNINVETPQEALESAIDAEREALAMGMKSSSTYHEVQMLHHFDLDVSQTDYDEHAVYLTGNMHEYKAVLSECETYTSYYFRMKGHEDWKHMDDINE